MEPPLITVMMTVYNDEKYLSKAIDSLLAQTYQNFVFLITDDSSTDKSSEICSNYAATDSRITYIQHKQNMGSYRHTKWALKQIRTPFVMQCAGHDLWHP